MYFIALSLKVEQIWHYDDNILKAMKLLSVVTVHNAWFLA